MMHREKADRPESADAERPSKAGLSLAALGTVAFFLEATAYSVSVFLGNETVFEHLTFQSYLSHDVGKLVTWGPFRYVRHPPYLGYFLMFFGFPLLVVCFIALIPLIAIPGYVQLTYHEERLLVKEFGNQYVKYQRKTGRFFPRL